MNYHEIIKAEFLRRSMSDPFYSLRDFAKDLGLLPSHMSYVLKGERGISKDNALRVAFSLGLITFAARRFCFLVSAQSARSKVERNLAKQGLKRKWLREAKTLKR